MKNILADGIKVASLVQKHYGDFHVVGFSLGSVVASYVASKKRVLSLIMIGSFDNIANLAKDKFGINLSLVLRYKFNNIEYVKMVDAPTYLFASVDDEVTYIARARNLKKSIKNLHLYKELKGLSHKELLWSNEVAKKINSL